MTLTVLAAIGGPSALSIVRALAAFLLLIVGFAKVRRNPGRAARPWAILLFGGAVALGSAGVRLLHGALDGVAYAYPSPADLLAYVSYSLMIVGGVAFVRARTKEHYRADFVDSVIVTFLSGLLVYTFVLAGYAFNDEIAQIDRIGNVIYSIMTVVLVGITARVSFGPGVRNGSYYLLAVSVGIIVANDILLLLDTVGQPGAYTISSIIAPLAFFFAAAAIVHSGSFALADRPEYREQQLTTARIVLLLLAISSGPVLLFLERIRSSQIHMAIVVSLWLVLAFGVVLRLILLVQDRDALTDRERSLRTLASRLTTLRSEPEIIDSSLSVGLEFAPTPGRARLALLDVRRDDRLGVIAVVGSAAPNLAGVEITTSGSAQIVREAVSAGHALAFEMVSPVESEALDESECDRQFVAIAPVRQRTGVERVLAMTSPSLIGRERVAALASLAGQLGLALDGVIAAEELHQRRSTRRFQALVENSSDVVLVVGDQGSVTFVSPTVQRLLGRAESQVLGTQVWGLLCDEDQDQLERLLASPASVSGGSRSIQVRLRHGSGDLRWFELEARDLQDEQEICGVVVTARDIDDRKRAEAQLLRSEARFRLMVQNSSDVVAIVDENAFFSYVSSSIHRMLGFSPAELVGRNVYELLSITEAQRLKSSPIVQLSGSTIEVRVQNSTGQIRTVEVGVTDMRQQPEVDGIVLNIRDVSERRRLEDDLRHQALHDDLTGLANRTLFNERLDSAMRSSAHTGELIAVLFIDLDDFKLINDSLGHAVGDQVLVDVADRVQQCLRMSDMAARLGGDEFAVLLGGVYGESDIVEITDRIRDVISQPVLIGQHDFRMTASIGIAIAGVGTKAGDDLLRSADLAMYRAKHGGKNRHEMFEDYMEVSAVQELELKTSLKRAIDRREFILHYQPIVQLPSGRICGAEALIRWEDPIRGMVSPSSFIPLAEETGLINEIGMWVAQQASADLARWRADGHDLYCSINVSGRQMSEPGFSRSIIDVVRASGADPRAMIIELTESVLAASGINEVFDDLHTEGFRIALDDFGTGYSALQYLQSLDIDIIKIDRSFVTALGETKNATVVQAVIDMATNIGAQTLAEGIENPNELRLLNELGVQLGQGYYFSKPVPVAELLQLLAANGTPKRHSSQLIHG